MAKYRFATTGKWSTAANWNEVGKETTHKVPGEGDDVVFDASSPACEITVEAKCRSLEASAYTKALKLNAGIILRVGGLTANGELALRFGEGMTFQSTGTLIFGSEAATVLKVTTGKQKMGETFFNGAGGKWQLQDAWNGASESGAARTLTVELGSLDTNGQTVEEVSTLSVTGTGVRTVKLGASTLKLAAWAAATTTNLTFEAGTSTIEIATAGGKFQGGGLTYATVIRAAEGEVSGSNTIATFKIQGNTKLAEGTTQTLEHLETTAKSGGEFKLESTKAGTAAKLSKATGNVNVNWLKITDVETNNAVSWYAGPNSTLSGKTEFWKAESEPGGKKTVEQAGILRLGATTPAGIQLVVLANGSLKDGTRTAAPAVLVATQAGSLKTGARLNTTGQRAVTAAGTLKQGARTFSPGALVATAAGTLKTGVATGATARSIVTGAAQLRAGVRTNASIVTTKVVEAIGQLYSGYRSSVTAQKVAVSPAALNTGSRAAATAVKVATAAGKLTTGARASTASSLIVKAAGSLRAGIRVVGTLTATEVRAVFLSWTNRKAVKLAFANRTPVLFAIRNRKTIARATTRTKPVVITVKNRKGTKITSRNL